MWVLWFVVVVWLAVVFFVGGVGACFVNSLLAGVGLVVGQIVMSVLPVPYGLCNCRRLFVSQSFCLWQCLGFVAFIHFLLLSFNVSGSSSFRFFVCHVGFAVLGLCLFCSRFVCVLCLFCRRLSCFFCCCLSGGVVFQCCFGLCLLGFQNSLGCVVVWGCVLGSLVS